MAEKIVQLERKREPEGQLGSFGFSVLGGAGTKFPAVVCEVDSEGPAFKSGEVHVGDHLIQLNGEELNGLSPSDLVQRIRAAPSPSMFLLGEDETLRQQVVSLLKKQERRAVAKHKDKAAADSHTNGRIKDQRPPRKTSSPIILTDDRDKEREKKRTRKHERIIVVEPSVNINDGRSGDIVQVLDNKIVGRIERSDVDDGSDAWSHRKSPQRSPEQVARGVRHRTPPSPLSSHHHSDSSSVEGQLPYPSNASPRASAGSTLSAGSTGSLEQRTALPLPSGLDSAQEVKQSDRPFETKRAVGLGSRLAEVTAVDVLGASERINEDSSNIEISDQASHNEGSNQITRLLSPVREQRSSSEPPNSPSSDSSRSQPPDSPRALLISDEQREKLMRKYRNLPQSPAKRRSNPQSDAIILARRLYMLDGFMKSEVAEKLSDPSEFGHTVGHEYLKFFEFDGLDLTEALRLFLSAFSLTGESQQRERVMVHFSERYFECNAHSFPSGDAVHGLTIALLLLNTDLHTDHGGHKMTFSQFATNLKGIEVKFPKDVLKQMYENIRKHPLPWADDDLIDSLGEAKDEFEDEPVRIYHVTIPGTFVEVELSEDTQVFKEGLLLRKNIMEGPHKKVPRGKRTWKKYYVHLKGFLMYFAPPEGELHLDDTSSAITVNHCLAMRAADYNKKDAVLRVTTSDWQAFLLQALDVTDMQQWIGAINTAAAIYSSPPLASAVSSSLGFQKPTFPITPTKNSKEQQIECHEAKVKSLNTEFKEHQAYKPTGKHAKHSKLQDWFDKYEFLQFEVQRFSIYLASLTTGAVIDFNAPLPSGLIPSPSINTLATPGDGFLAQGTSAAPPRSRKLAADSKDSQSPLFGHSRRKYS